MRLEQIDLSTWASALPPSGFEVFHLPAALEVLDGHTSATMRLYAAYKGQEPVGLLPVFVEQNALGRAALSPPPSMGVPRLGPLVMPTSPKQRKQESVNGEFVDLLVEELEPEASRSLLRLECPLSYDDPRPFEWADFDVDPTFTYVLDLESTTTDAVKRSFSKDLRREIRSADDAGVTVDVEGPEAAMRVYHDVAARYDQQDESFALPEAYFEDLVEAMDERCRVYVARDPDGDYLSGIVALYSNDTAAFWQGGVRHTYDGVSVNTRLHWEIIADLVEDPPLDSVWGYDLVGANTPRLCRYKAKFGADLVPYYTLETGGLGMSVAKRAYQFVSR